MEAHESGRQKKTNKHNLTLNLPQSQKEERRIARLKKYLNKQWLKVFQISEKTEPCQFNKAVKNPKKYTAR